jgi:hypothetical protein
MSTDNFSARSFVFTINNYSEKNVENLRAIPCKAIICGKEVGEQGTPHIQGAIVFNANMRRDAFKSYDMMPNKWWTGYTGEAVVYMDDPPVEWGRVHLMGNIKRWVNEHPFNCCVHGGITKVRFRRMVVSANAPPGEYMGGSYEEPPFLARFKVIEITSREQLEFLR